MKVWPVFTIVLFWCSFPQSQNSANSSGTTQEQHFPQQIETKTQPMAAIGLNSPYQQTDFAAVVADGRHAVSWRKGYLLSFGDAREPLILYDKNGAWLFETPLTVEKAVRTFVQDAAPTPGGNVVVAASAVSPDGATADMIVEVGKKGILRAIRTSPFYPLRICATEEGTTWAYGKELNEERRREPRVHYPMLREYSLDSGQLRSEIDRASVHPPQGVPVSGRGRDDVQLKCNSEKVALISGPTNELIEYDLSTNKLSRWPMTSVPEGFELNGVALTDSGEVYVSAFRGGYKAQTGMFDVRITASGTAEWVPLITGPAQGNQFILLGSDGESLVYSRGLQSPTLFWSEVPQNSDKTADSRFLPNR